MKNAARSSAVKGLGLAWPIPRFKSRGSWLSGTTLFDDIDFVRRSHKAIRYLPGR